MDNSILSTNSVPILSTNRRISIAIPHYNTSQYIMDAIGVCVRDTRVSEIIICDDASCDAEIKKLESILKMFGHITNKIRLYKNDKNLGCYHNKLQAISKCTNAWAILFDADNIIQTDYINTLFELPVWDDNVIYHPCWAKTFPVDPGNPTENMDFRVYENQTIDAAVFLNEFNKPQTAKFQCLINNCNYFVPVTNFIQCMQKYDFERETMDVVDSAALFTFWLCSGKQVFVVKDLLYRHRIHKDSNSVVSTTHKYRDEMIAKLRGMLVHR